VLCRKFRYILVYAGHRVAFKEAEMRNSFIGRFAAGLIAAITLVLVHGGAQAMPNSTADGLRDAASNARLVENAQYVWNGRRYCWYENGWNGPGWYVCNYGPWVRGFWWGGGVGWHGWRHVGHHVAHHARHHVAHHARHKAGHHVAHHRGAVKRGHHVAHHRGAVSRGHHVAHRGGMHRGGGHRGGGGRGGGRRSDIRLKQDITPLVRLDNGLELYRFRYKGTDHTFYVGVMAQEVRKIQPSAVWRDHNGYFVVDYDRIGLKFTTWKEWLRRTDQSFSAGY
jgi:Chaperone of endosialidase